MRLIYFAVVLAVFLPVSMEGFTPILCGQFVDRILSTQPIRNGRGSST